MIVFGFDLTDPEGPMHTREEIMQIGINGILGDFVDHEGLPVEAIQAATLNSEEIAPVFVDIIERHANAAADIDPTTSPIFLVFHMLGQLRWKPAYRPLARFLRIDSEHLHEFIGDAITETSHRVMAAVYDGDPKPIYEIIEDDDADDLIRGGMFELLGMLARTGEMTRGEVARYLRDSYSKLRHEPGSYVWVGWQDAIAMLGLDELTFLVERIFETRVIDPGDMDFEDFLSDLENGISGGSGSYGQWKRMTPFGECIDELADWATFKPAGDKSEALSVADEVDALAKRLLDEGYLDDYHASLGQPHINPSRQVGRNDPCPCGSGRKFKKCCLQ